MFVGSNQEVIISQDRIVESIFYFEDSFEIHEERNDNEKQIPLDTALNDKLTTDNTEKRDPDLCDKQDFQASVDTAPHLTLIPLTDHYSSHESNDPLFCYR